MSERTKDMAAPKPVALVILDGWGYSESMQDNAIAAAHTPVWDRLWGEHSTTLIDTSGEAVGLPPGQMGNSEVGHLNLGSGRVVYQDYTRINKAIGDGSFARNEVLVEAVEAAGQVGGAVHILGLASPGGVHSHERHLLAMIELAAGQGADEIYLHTFLDGRDVPPKSAAATLERLQHALEHTGRGRISTLCGRYFAMDRDQRWERISKAWDALVHGRAEYAARNPLAALEAAYQRGETDEFVAPTLIGEPAATIRDGDAVIFMNFRADRARQLTRAFIENDFDGFDRGAVPKLAAFATLTQYQQDFGCPAAFPPAQLPAVFGEVLADHGLKQLRLAETEKYAHVTFFFNGQETPFEGEERQLIASPKVATYDLQPQMSATQVTDALVQAIASKQYDAIICNYANADMVGHTGDFQAAVQAVECIDQCLGRIVAAMEQAGGALLVTADHGNVEKMRDQTTGQAHTAHTSGPVPLVYLGSQAYELREGGALQDVAPTLLDLLGLDAPNEMTGRSLLRP